MRRIVLPTLLAGLAALVLIALALAPEREPRETVKAATSDELSRLFDSHSYGGPFAADMKVPRLLLASLPADFGAMAVPASRKALFLRALLPLVLTANEAIAGDRAQLLALAAQLDAGAPPSAEQADWLAALMRHYRVPASGDLATDLAELLRRVDAVPPSMALAQAALESGWGTSRLARDGNALFGERTWTEAGLVPLAPLPGERHRARSFDRLLDAVDSYLLNLNSHPAYADFRAARAQLRAAGEIPQGEQLIRHLTRYSERGRLYTGAVRDLIRANRLQALDGAALLPAAGSI